ncbi:unnamed protein product [Zymoseptoria tritici ST99CH_3D1]|nr:unnamed protein product [Zymoseptoria tritici ST99CH_3D1]
MATEAHCAYCFETISAQFEGRKPLALSQVEDLWEQYHASTGTDAIRHDEEGSEYNNDDDGTNILEAEESSSARPAAISRLLNRQPTDSAASSNSSLPSTTSSSSPGSKAASGAATPASSTGSHSSILRRTEPGEKHPLFVTWNTISRSGNKSLRGCIGTFEAQRLEYGLRSYALTSAFEDTRFSPIPASLLPSLSVHVTLLTNFSQPVADPLAWTLGKHGIRIKFSDRGRSYGATYLPDVATEQGWTKEEAIVSLMKKGGWHGSSSSWQKAWRDGKGELVTYEGKQVGLHYPEWRAWRDWVDEQDVEATGSA